MKGTGKVFCIGWHKTGTSTLGLALLELGYSVVGARLDLEEDLRRGDCSAAIKLAAQFDAVQDVPWAVLFEELDAAFPEARFVFTDRSDTSWLCSAVNHFGKKNISMHDWLYGNGRCLGNESLYLERFQCHRRDVQAWFSDRPDHYLEMNLEQGDGWEKLCEFLGRPIPASPWPHANKGNHSQTKLELGLIALREFVPFSIRKALFSLRLRIRAVRGKPDPRNRFNNFSENRSGRRKQNDSGN